MVGPVFSSLSFLLWGSYLRSPPSRSQSRLLYRIMQIVMTDRRAGPPLPSLFDRHRLPLFGIRSGRKDRSWPALPSFIRFYRIYFVCCYWWWGCMPVSSRLLAGASPVWVGFSFSKVCHNTVTRSIQCQLVIVDFFSYFYGLEPLNGPPLHYRHVGY